MSPNGNGMMFFSSYSGKFAEKLMSVVPFDKNVACALSLVCLRSG